MYQISLHSCDRETCLPFGTCPDSSKNECGETRKDQMKSHQLYMEKFD